jgi:hypothetical protein
MVRHICAVMCASLLAFMAAGMYNASQTGYHVTALASTGFTPATAVSISGTNFQINGTTTSPNGLLLNSRMIQGVFDDENATTAAQWVYPDTHVWNPARNTAELVANIPPYVQHGVRLITVGLQGGGPINGQFGANQPNITTAFNSDGSLKAAWIGRLDQVIQAADANGMVVNVQCYYGGQVGRMANNTAIQTGINNVVDHLVAMGYKNVTLELANEIDQSEYGSTNLSPGSIPTLMAATQIRAVGKIPVAVSFNGGAIPPGAVVSQADFILLHGNGQNSGGITNMVNTVRNMSEYKAKPKPIAFNEDSTSISNMDAAVNAVASWGYYDQGSNNYTDGFQSPPVNWTINTSSKTAFFNRALALSGAPRPTIGSVAPTNGPAGGGTSLAITGTNLAGATAVKFGAAAAATYTVNSATQITATSPPGYGSVDVTVTTSGGTSATAAADRFTYTVGLLRVTTTPALSSQIFVDGNIADSWGLNWLEIAPGSHTVCFGAVEGYTTPACQTVAVSNSATTTVNGSFVQRGFLHVFTSPALPSTISVDGIPRDDWGVFTDLPTGSHQVCFGLVKDFTPPACQTAIVTAGATTSITGTFTSSPGASGQTNVGLLRVATSPAVASQITVDGNIADSWGLNWLEIAPGSHTVCFTPREGFTTPACQTVAVTANASTLVTGTFVQRGFLHVFTSPASPGTAFINGIPSDDWGVFTDLPPATYQVCFGAVLGFANTPACQSAVVTAGTTTVVTGAYS